MKDFKKIVLMLIFGLLIVGCSSDKSQAECGNEFEKNPIATIKVKDYGTMKFELYINQAPQTVANFAELANKGFYNGLTIHRIDEGLGIIQGGDPNGDGTGGPGYSIKGEVKANGHCNALENDRGTIAMARSQSYDSGGSQFFINFKNNTKIFTGDNQYAVFGKIIEGEDVMDKIGAAKTNDSTPTPSITIESISVDTFDQKLPVIEKIK